MASIIRHTAVWTGSPGLPGYTQLYQSHTTGQGTDAQVGHDAVHDLFEALAALIPEEITVTVDPLYQIIDAVTGETTGEFVVGTPAAVTAGEYVGGWASQVGVLIEWVTGTFLNGRRLRGRTYLVPLGATTETDGTLPATTVQTVAAAAANVVNSTIPFVVWHRPVNSSGGSTSNITGAQGTDRAAILRSRMV